MRLVTAAESLEIDRRSSRNLQPDHWMEIAGRLMAQKISQLNDCRRPLLFLCGPGNNGGDGYVVIKNLVSLGFREMKIIHTSAGSSLCEKKLKEAQSLGLDLCALEEIHKKNIPELLRDHAVVDAVFGVGLAREVGEPWKEIFQKVNEKAKLIISLDVPSGLDATTGNVLGEVLRADHTLVVAPLKSGLFLNAGPQSAGRIHKIDIGFPSDIVNSCAKSVRLIGQRTCESLKPRRKWSSNKTLFGHVAVVGGSAGFEGAAILAAEAALRAGVGYVSIFSDSPKMHHRAPAEILLQELKDFEEILKKKKINAVVFGPGLKPSPSAERIFEKLKDESIPVLLDAGGFEFVKKNQRLPEHWVLTPHAGELSRLLAVAAAELERDRLAAALRGRRKLGGVLVFKGFRTVVCANEMSYIIASGNPSLAKSGTGDVLSGIIGSYLAQGLLAAKAAALGAWTHGRLADRRLQAGGSVDSLMASDLIDELKNFQ